MKVSAESWQLLDQTKKKSLHKGVAGFTLTNTHTYTPHICVYSRPQMHVHTHTHTHTHNLPHTRIDICIQKHTCQGLSTV
ncbi:hypothetical protein FQN60_010119 [Etheostoma spectabile]|uniref:Uncharacterized protein n=1 Tax=Etheostoma spectabile TaxID=54343 RepID=A0A5J5D5T6_9PERO|nr:hypothetical protein FQN60_010119 [Etheostoma spectabile]